ncbi:unnamed protein product [Miscanthus lutarioriparius]|uniref:Uncharacterized protein n=1 Tax=Miscanthus lutarioriparius TaxID=422564 RepID=A0A811MD81_9POAL|nr:unnamed protein product [Miscanthus lutarioriparius]
MVSGEAGGKKRKASAAENITSPAARREPRRGLGVAELERIRVALEMAERCYAAASSLSSAPKHHPPPALPLVVHAAGVAAAPGHHQHSSSSASQRQGHRRAHAKPGQTTAPPQVAFVDLVDSDDETFGGDVEELDLELKL